MNAAPAPSPAAPAQIPPGIFCAQDYETHAERLFAEPVHAYIAGGTATGATVAANRRAFEAWSVVPRVLRDVTAGHTALTLHGQALPHPVLLAPVAYQKLAHPAGERETAQAARVTGTTMVLSTLSTATLEDVALSGEPDRWFQLYLQPSEETTLALVRGAEGAGYRALVLTLDATIQASGHRALRAGFQLPAECRPANLPDVAPPALGAGAGSRIFQGAMRHAPTAEQVRRIITATRLPVWIKGVMHPDDARALLALGANGLVVSNHGGRSLDGAPAALDMLPRIREAVGSEVPLLMDGGIRSGTDVFKAIALGADAVLVGRLQLYALRVAGALGVAHMLKLLGEELETTMALAGCATLADIGRDALVPARGG